MRSTLVAASLLLCAIGQAAGQNSFGAGLVYSNQSPQGLGFQLGGYRPVQMLQGLRFGADFTYYLPAADSLTFFGHTFDYTARLWELNGNLQYHFAAWSRLSPYSLGGINVSRRAIASASSGDTVATPQSLTMFNGAVGAGIEVAMGPGVFYGEGRYLVAPGRRRSALGFGVRIRR